jgi:amidase
LTAGGSSGGEGALVAMRGSILGVGTDIAGSIRIPSLCCGTFGFKPTADRVPYGGQESVERPGRPGIMASAGPLVTSARDLELFLQAVLSHPVDDYDTSVLAVGWRPVPQKSKLTIGVLQEDPAYPLFPPVARSLAAAVEKLRAAGHTIIPLDGAPSLVEPCTTGFGFFSLDNTKAPFKVIESSGEPLVPSVVGVLGLQIGKLESITLEELFDLNTARRAYSAQWTKAWVDAKIDVLIGPGAETTAVPHDAYGYPPYTVVWNYLDVSIV